MSCIIERNTQKNPTLFALEGRVFFVFLLSPPCCIFNLNLFRDISQIKARSSLINELFRVRKRKLNLFKRNVIKLMISIEKLGFHQEGNVMNETYIKDINGKASGNITICATNMPTRGAKLIRSLNVLKETKYYQLHGNNLKLRKWSKRDSPFFFLFFFSRGLRIDAARCKL